MHGEPGCSGRGPRHGYQRRYHDHGQVPLVRPQHEYQLLRGICCCHPSDREDALDGAFLFVEDNAQWYPFSLVLVISSFLFRLARFKDAATKSLLGLVRLSLFSRLFFCDIWPSAALPSPTVYQLRRLSCTRIASTKCSSTISKHLSFPFNIIQGMYLANTKKCPRCVETSQSWDGFAIKDHAVNRTRT